MFAAELMPPTGESGALPMGWFHHGPQILRLVDEHRPKVCVELGTWLGASAIPVAMSVRRWDGTVTCIDTWSGDVDNKRVKDPNGTPWQLVTCAKNVRAAGVGASVRFILASTADAAAAWSGPPINYLYVDADHSEAGVKADLEAWVPHLAKGALLLGDDYDNPWFPGVKRAWDDFEASRGLTLTRYQSDPPHPEGLRLIYGTV